MKKFYSTQRFIRYNERRAERSLQRRLKSAEIKRRNRRAEEGLPLTSDERRRIRAERKGAMYAVTAPANFSFINNTAGMITFIERLDTLWRKRRPVWVHLKGVEQIDYDGIVVLLSVMIRFKARNIDFNGDFPLKPAAREILHSSGFFTALELSYNDRDHYKVGSGAGIVTHAHKAVDAKLTDGVLKKGAKIVWGKSARSQGAQRVFLELMQNTNNHASLSGRGVRHWWVSASHDAAAKKISFAFVDYGVGVFKSLRSKKEGDKFFGSLEKMLIGLTDKVTQTDAQILKRILAGDLHRTASGKYYRGKGLPGIKEAHDRNWISNLHIITNKVKANVSGDVYELMPTNFEGTFLHWEITETNTHCSDDDS